MPPPTLGTYTRFARRHALLLACCMGLGLLGGLGWELQQPPRYSATASVMLAPVPSYVSVEASDRFPRLVTIDTDAQLLQHPAVLDAVATAVDEDKATVAGRLTVTAAPLTRVLRLTFSAESPREAAAGAAAAAGSFVRVRQETLAALQDDQVRQLGFKLTELQDRFNAQDRNRPVVSSADPLLVQIAELRDRFVDLQRTQTTPAQISKEATPPTAADSANSEVPLTSGGMLGLLAGSALGALFDVLRRRRRRAAPH